MDEIDVARFASRGRQRLMKPFAARSPRGDRRHDGSDWRSSRLSTSAEIAPEDP